MKPLASPQQRQHGFALIEALVSLVILALGVLGLAAVQARMLVETRTTNSRAVAIRLIGELNERMQLNPTGANPPTIPVGSLSAYSDGSPATFQGKVTVSKDCTTDGPCDPATQAAYDVATWRNNIASSLMGGRASIWQISPRQLQVVVAWQANENTKTTLSDAAANAASQKVVQEMSITATAAGNTCGLSTDTICHIDFIDIPPGK